MKLLLNILALICVFFCFKLFAVEKILAENNGGFTFNCTYNGNVAQVKDTEFSVCEDVIKTGILQDTTFPSVSSGFTDWSQNGPASCSSRDLLGNGSYYMITCIQEFISSPVQPDNTRSPELFESSKVGSLDNKQPDTSSFICPDPNYPNGPTEYNFEMWCYKIDSDPDCPEPTQDDLFVSGVYNQSTTVCYDAGNNRQCTIFTNPDGSYLLPISYSSQEPVTCVPDSTEPVEPPIDPPVEPTPEPQPPEDPAEADDSDKTELIDAANQINDNLKSINDNLNIGVDANVQRLDRIAQEIQISNELADLANSKSNTSNELLLDISQSEKEQIDGQNDILSELEKLNNTSYSGEFNPDNSASFLESSYPDGFEGVWNEKSEELKSSDAYQFIQQFQFQSGGAPPQTQICFNLGTHMDFGCADLPLPSVQLLSIIKVFILITAAFLCRALIFGG